MKNKKILLISTLIVAFVISSVSGIQVSQGLWGTPGSISLTYPISGGTYEEQLRVKFSISVNSGFSYISSYIYIDNDLLDDTTQSSYDETFYDLGLSVSSHTIKVTAYFSNSWGMLSYVQVTRSFNYALIDNNDRILIIFHATDAVVQSKLVPYANQMVNEEGFDSVHYFEDTTTWQSDLDSFDNLEGPNTLLFIYICAHGYYDTPTQDSYSRVSASSTNPIRSSEFKTKLQIFESNKILVFVESCHSGGFTGDLSSLSNVCAIATSSTSQVSYVYTEMGLTPNTVGVMTYYYFDGLHKGKNNVEAYTYACSKLMNWLVLHGYSELAQTPRISNPSNIIVFG